MKRREVLALGAATAAAASAPGCAWQGLAGGGFVGSGSGPIVDIDAFVAELDRKLDAMINPLGGILQHGKNKSASHLNRDARAKELVRKSLRSLVMVSAFHDLPEDARLHPAVQARMWGAMPDMDDAVVGMTSLLESMSPAEKKAAANKMKADPDLPMRIAESIDAEARAVGLNSRGRGRLRGLATTLSWRMRNQPPSMLFDDDVAKMQRIVARRGSEAQRERLLAMEMTQAAFWSSLAASPQNTPIDPNDTTNTSTTGRAPVIVEEEEDREPGAAREVEPPKMVVPREDREEREPGYEEPPRAKEIYEDDGPANEDATNSLLVGGLALGFGLGATLGGAVILATGWGGILGATVGALVLMLGVSLIIGGVIGLIAAGVEKATEGRDVDLPGG